jgi:hypothetical protein
MFHVCLHVWRDPAAASGGADEELHQGQESGIAVLLVVINPFVDDNLDKKKLFELKK